MPANTQDLKRRIGSVQNTKQITHTMEMVATSKLKRAGARVEAARPYADALDSVIERLLDPELRERYPLLREPEETRRAAVVLLTSNRGLAGAFNVNLIRQARDRIAALGRDGADVDLHVVGKKGISFFEFQDVPLASRWTDLDDRPTTEDAAALIDPLVDGFERGELDGVHVVYSQFRSALSTPPAVKRVLPVRSPQGAEEGGRAKDYILSPSADEILNRLLPLYLRNSVYRALVENAAAEQGSRRTAMKNATDNANEMLDDLRRTYNRARQAQITQEIAEIVGGAEALE